MTARRAIVIGSDRLGLRIGEQLERDGCAVTLLAVPGSWLAEAATPTTWQVLRARPDTQGVLAQAGLAEAEALLAVSDQDDLNLGAALAAREQRPEIRLVLRQFNVRLGRLLQGYLPDAQILSLSALAAPTFALAALGPGVVFAHDAGAELVVLREVAGAGASAAERESALAAATPAGVRFGPAAADLEAATRLLLVEPAYALPRHPRGPAAVPRAAGGGSAAPEAEGDRLLRYTLLALLAVLLAVAAIFRARLGLSALDAVYFVSTILTTVGFGDYNLKDADRLSKLVGIAAMFAGLFLSAMLVALVTNKLLARQAARQRGHYRQRLQGHVVVCGLGTVGVRIVQALLRLGVPVVAVDPAPRERLAALVRSTGVPLVVADASEEQGLMFANLSQARALVVATGHDHLNLEIGLLARSLVPELPVVLRLFDPELCRRVAATFGISATFSGASLGAGMFAAFAVGGTRLASLHFAGVPYALHLATARAGTTVAESGAGLRAFALAVVDAAGRPRLRPSDDERLSAGEGVLLLLPEEAPAAGA